MCSSRVQSLYFPAISNDYFLPNAASRRNSFSSLFQSAIHSAKDLPPVSNLYLPRSAWICSLENCFRAVMSAVCAGKMAVSIRAIRVNVAVPLERDGMIKNGKVGAGELSFDIAEKRNSEGGNSPRACLRSSSKSNKVVFDRIHLPRV